MNHETRLLPAAEIKIGARHRRDLGDLHAFAARIEATGLLQPIGVTPQMELIFGERRLRACRDVLGWETIPARIIPIPAIALGEYAENMDRKDFTPSERVAVVDTLRGYGHGGDRRPDQGRNGDVGRLTIKQAAALVGDSRDDYYRAKKVVERGVPDLVRAMDEGVISVSLAAKVAEEEAEVQREVVGAGLSDAAWVANKIRAVKLGQGYRRRRERAQLPAAPPTGTIVDGIVQGDCMDLLRLLPDRSVHLVLTSPPYAEQRDDFYRGVPEDQYPEFTVRWMSLLRDKLADGGSVLIVIDAHVEDGIQSDYVRRTEQALCDDGWRQHRTQIWFKPDMIPLGHKWWPRHCYEQILWFSGSGEPFCDPWAAGKPSKRLGLRGYRWSNWSEAPVEEREGIAKVTDVLRVPVGLNEDGIAHSAMYPVELAGRLIQTHCPQGGLVVDCFAGSGSTLVAAKRLGRKFCGFELEGDYCRIAEERLAKVDGEPAPIAG